MRMREIGIFCLFGMVVLWFTVGQRRAPAQFRRPGIPGKIFAKTVKTEGRTAKTYKTGYYRSSRSSRMVTRTPQMRIPAGKFGLELSDGSRLIGVPAKTWSATLKSRFGIVTIPRDEIARIDTNAGEIRVYLKNGDRVSGTWVSKSMRFETQFGALTLPASSLVRLIAGESTQPLRSGRTSYVTPVRTKTVKRPVRRVKTERKTR